MREYDQSLVKKIQQKTYIKNIDGEDIVMKPVPDDDRECVVDPRVVETTKIKMTVNKTRFHSFIDTPSFSLV